MKTAIFRKLLSTQASAVPHTSPSVSRNDSASNPSHISKQGFELDAGFFACPPQLSLIAEASAKEIAKVGCWIRGKADKPFRKEFFDSEIPALAFIPKNPGTLPHSILASLIPQIPFLHLILNPTNPDPFVLFIEPFVAAFHLMPAEIYIIKHEQTLPL
jgi:hypothetical protein